MKLNSSNAKSLSLAAAILLTFAVSRPSQAQIAYSVTDVGTLGDYTYANDINNLGQIVGYSNQIAFISDAGGNIKAIRAGNEANAINDAGQVVGPAGPGWKTRPFLYDNGSVTYLTWSGGMAMATAINNRGQIVGSSFGYTPHALLWDGSTSAQDLGTLGGRQSMAFGINESGQVTGYSYVTSPFGSHAFLYSNGVMQDIGVMVAGGASTGFGINDLGHVVGIGSATLQTSHAFLYKDGVMQDLGTIPGYPGSLAFDVNNADEVVGYATDVYSNAVITHHAILYAAGSMYDLNDLIPADSGWILEAAHAINDHGQIVGFGDHNGEASGFLLTPLGGSSVGGSAVPEPTALAFLTGLAVPGITLALRVRRNRRQ